MRNVLVFSIGRQGSQEALQLDEAIEQYHQGNNVTLIYCDETIGGCNENPQFNKSICKFCKWNQKRLQKKYLPKGIKTIAIGEIINKLEIQYPKFVYNNIDEIKKIKFHDVEIGMGAVSTFISLTRNISPEIDERYRLYFDSILRSEIRITLAIEDFLLTNEIDIIVFHNGRYATFKPFLNIAQNRGIDFICTESYTDKYGNISKDYFYNDIPHNITPRHKKYLIAWNEAITSFVDAKNIGKAFFEKRRNSEGTGDKIYTAGQSKDLIVSDWDDTKENIVIFNSSEDEFFAVGSEYEKAKLFKNQLEGIKSIVEHYKNDPSKHFYLRVHPNLIPVKQSFHLDLYKLDYFNLTVIPADSPISSYALLNRANKVITFGSTMGIEATYAHKPSICIGASLYEQLNIAYHPRSINELWSLIDNQSLKDRYSEDIMIYGYYYYGRFNSNIYNYCRHINVTKTKCILFGKTYSILSFEKLLGSQKLYLAVRRIWRLYSNLNRNKISVTIK